MSPSARIGIDVRKLRDFGIGSYIRALLRGLAELDTTNRYYLFCFAPDRVELNLLPENFSPVTVDCGHYSLTEHYSLRRQSRRLELDLYHAPHYVLPYRLHCPSLVTVHDCIHFIVPGVLSSGLARWWARRLMKAALKSARAILTVSETSRQDIVRLFQVAEDRIRVIPNGVDEKFRRSPDSEVADAFRKRYSPRHPFFLSVGNLKPHKNLHGLLEAFFQFKEEHNESVELWLAGIDPDRGAIHRDRIGGDRDVKAVRFLGRVPDSELPALYRNSLALVLPSFYEGFGLPALEAMASGVPVICSNRGALPEVVGDAAIQVEPERPEEIREAMKELIHSPRLRQKMSEEGIKRAEQFSWAESVRKIHETYEELL